MIGTPRTLKGRARLDAAVLGAIALLAFLCLSKLDAFEWLTRYVADHESWQLDELLISLGVVGLGGFVFSLRRYADAVRELRKRRAAQADVTWLSHYDPLTELPNRRKLNEFVRHFDSADADERKTGCYAIYSIDLDGFKQINDLHGHAAGDRLLQTVAARLISLFPDDLVVRLGGDEFLVVAKTEEETDVAARAEELLGELRAPIAIDRVHAEIGASIGIVRYPVQAATMQDAIRFGDIAMYAAKKSPGVNIAGYQAELLVEAEARALLTAQLKSAVANDDITPHYQPLVDLVTGRIYGFEVLARWTRPGGEAVPPAVFIPLAEEAGLISDLSQKLLGKACREAMAWPDTILLSFNLSPTQLSDRLIGLRIVSVLDETGFLPSRLEIEITESAMIRDSETALDVLNRLQALGIRVALDDFGTGYSSLSQMSKFSFNRLKIDQSFIRDFQHDEKQNKIVKAIIALGAGLSVATTAEGIEEPGQLVALRELGCDSGQGYLLGRPMSFEDATDALVRAGDPGSKAVTPAPRQKRA
ncbi:putative bifunctional diguanylate cyclase/phosphodiesterase [Hoeflea olei]|uniref:Diguanylate cyclase n=1 Tax=Hoeflea olei TaxID=1480615 RepID=A0A1C1YVS4_9HYPH|nr:EAL domain-containing protein [Hoeflea olei]OCW57595.1 hypothetical protein AWJ14_01880 [Hoeflea olei]